MNKRVVEMPLQNWSVYEQNIIHELAKWNNDLWGKSDIVLIGEKLAVLLQKVCIQNFSIFLQKNPLQPLELAFSNDISKDHWGNIKIVDKQNPIHWVYSNSLPKILRHAQWPLELPTKNSRCILAPIPVLRNTEIWPYHVAGVLIVTSEIPIRPFRFIVSTIANHIGISLSQSWLYKSATVDSLSGVYCRSHFLDILHDEMVCAKKQGNEISLLIMDIDHFKKVNDRFTHLAGDEILQKFGSLLQNFAQPTGIPCRYGGEEFMLLWLSDYFSAMVCAENIRKKTEQEIFHVQLSNEAIRLTVSIGVATFNSTDTLEDWIEKADKSLYCAKLNGRNCVVGNIKNY